MWKYIVAAAILLLFLGKKASAATGSSLLPTGTGQRPPEQGVSLGSTGTRLCCGTAAPVIPSIAPQPITITPQNQMNNRIAAFQLPVAPVSQIRYISPLRYSTL